MGHNNIKLNKLRKEIIQCLLLNRNGIQLATVTVTWIKQHISK